MRELRPIRLIKKSSSTQTDENRTNPAKNERELRNVVTTWVREHRVRSEEFRRTFAAMLASGEFRLPAR